MAPTIQSDSHVVAEEFAQSAAAEVAAMWQRRTGRPLPDTEQSELVTAIWEALQSSV